MTETEAPKPDRPPKGKATKPKTEIVASPTEQPLKNAYLMPYALLIPHHERSHGDEESLIELADDIKVRGILEPLIVRPVGRGKYEIVAGHRRWRAAGMAGLTEVPVIVRQSDDRQAQVEMLVENIHREELHPLDRQEMIKALKDTHNLSSRQIARLLNKSESYVSRSLSGKSGNEVRQAAKANNLADSVTGIEDAKPVTTEGEGVAESVAEDCVTQDLYYFSQTLPTNPLTNPSLDLSLITTLSVWLDEELPVILNSLSAADVTVLAQAIQNVSQKLKQAQNLLNEFTPPVDNGKTK